MFYIWDLLTPVTKYKTVILAVTVDYTHIQGFLIRYIRQM